MFVKKSCETVLKIVLYVEVSQKLLAKQSYSDADPDELCLKQQIRMY